MPEAGQLRERVRFERRTQVDDGAGNFEDGWTALDTVPAEIRPVTGNESVLAGKLEGRIPAQITIRWSRALGEGAGKIRTEDRAINARTGDIYNIRAVENRDMRKRWLTLTCEAGVAV